VGGAEDPLEAVSFKKATKSVVRAQLCERACQHVVVRRAAANLPLHYLHIGIIYQVRWVCVGPTPHLFRSGLPYLRNEKNKRITTGGLQISYSTCMLTCSG